MKNNKEELGQESVEAYEREFGDYAEAKVYFDGRYYIGIPYVPNRVCKLQSGRLNEKGKLAKNTRNNPKRKGLKRK